MRVHGVHRRGGDLGLYLSGKISSTELRGEGEFEAERSVSWGTLVPSDTLSP